MARETKRKGPQNEARGVFKKTESDKGSGERSHTPDSRVESGNSLLLGWLVLTQNKSGCIFLQKNR
jgi:hypothetical protein